MERAIAKRRFTIDCSLCTENNQTTVTSRLEDLSNEIFCEIFEHLDGYHMLKAFTNLNHRFQTLIDHPSIPLRLELDNVKTLLTEEYYQKIIQPNRHRLLSLNFMSDSLHSRFVHYFIFDASFTRLESLVLKDLSKKDLLIHCSYLTRLPRLFNLCITIFDKEYVHEITQVLCLIVSLPVLKRCAIINQMEMIDQVPKVILPIAMNSKPSSIEDLTIEDVASVETLVSLLKHLPNIRRLDAQFHGKYPKLVGELETINLPRFKYLSIDTSSMKFDHFKILLKSIGQNVEIFNLHRFSYESYLDAEQWEGLITTCLPRLKAFDIECEVTDATKLDSIYGLLRHFYSPFWIERRWLPAVRLSPFWVTFHIYTHKKQWFDQHREIEIDRISTRSPSNQHVFHELEKKSSRFDREEFNDLFDEMIRFIWIDEIKDFLLKIESGRLNVKCHEPVRSIFKLTSDLPTHFDSLYLTSVPNIDFLRSPREMTELQLLWTRNNRITKVKIESITKQEEIRYVMNSFPRMEYLELFLESDAVDVASTLEFILANRSMKVPNLRSICFDKVKNDREVLDQLRQVIEDESLIGNYHMKPVKNQIFIQWDPFDQVNI